MPTREERPTIFEKLPKTCRAWSASGGSISITEGLLLLTNDGGLARVLELPATGWLRRYRVRAHGQVTAAAARRAARRRDRRRRALWRDRGDVLDRMQGANVWLTFAIREGKNREVRNVLEHLGLQVNRLIRVSFGPFQLGELAEGDVDEVPHAALARTARRDASRRRRKRISPGRLWSASTDVGKLDEASRALERASRPRGKREAPTAKSRRRLGQEQDAGCPMRGEGRRELRWREANALRPAARNAPADKSGRRQAERADAHRRRKIARARRSPARTRRRSARPRTACASRSSTSSTHAYGDPITGARVLDLFAGTGALGLEALSRGAAFALFVDDGAEARALIRQNVEALGTGRRHPHLPPRRDEARPRASDRAVLAGLPRSALWQGARREGAGLGARGRMADARRVDCCRGSRRPCSLRRRASKRSSGAI